MRRIGTTTHGDVIIEMSSDEWNNIIERNAGACVDIAAELKVYRTKHGLPQQRVAEKVGVSRNYISLIEQGIATNMSRDIYRKILDLITEKV